ncbi:MAG: hypothetical protein QME77_09445 [bacterium]|nr:hypothetical protein [bacterium]
MPGFLRVVLRVAAVALVLGQVVLLLFAVSAGSWLVVALALGAIASGLHSAWALRPQGAENVIPW